MSRFELCENRDLIIITSNADGIRAGQYKSLNVYNGS